MSNFVYTYTYIKYIHDFLTNSFLDNFLNEPELIYMHIKYFCQTLIILLDIKHLFAHSEGVSNIENGKVCFICTQLNVFKYCNLTLTILLLPSRLEL